jgi:hypothetical protein
VRAWWAARQGLDGTSRGDSAAAVLERSGWARSVGGSGPYLTLHARSFSLDSPKSRAARIAALAAAGA